MVYRWYAEREQYAEKQTQAFEMMPFYQTHALIRARDGTSCYFMGQRRQLRLITFDFRAESFNIR